MLQKLMDWLLGRKAASDRGAPWSTQQRWDYRTQFEAESG